VENNRARSRTVEVGRRNGLVAEIVNGIGERDSVITHPDDRLKEGVRLRIR
jgi:HlyD family secretion protein